MTRRQRGFTIIEAVTAASILLATCVAISGVLSGATKAASVAAHSDHLEQVLESECQRLAALPYFRSNVAAGRPGGSPALPSLVSEVFPWARTELNTGVAHYVDASSGDEAGTFATTFEEHDVTVRLRAAFVRDDGVDPRHLGAEELAGWDCTSGAWPPSSALEISIEVSRQGHAASRLLVLSALRPSLEPSVRAAAL